ncbi:MAG TPA: thiamine phosphate synthase [Stenotrophomonas sp.]|nr:thiamine phosphate synthase [Stenotrophomonas sp.]
MNPSLARRGLYLITPDETDTASLLARTAPLLPGIAWLQYRNKRVDHATRKAQATALLKLCQENAVPLIVNDDVALAHAIAADGVHLGEDDGDIAAARALLGPQAIVGASCYDQLALAQRAVAAGASYVAFGAFFPSISKHTTRQADPSLLTASATLGVPRVAIGGITPDNGAALVDAGADLLAVISGVYAAPDPLTAVQAYRACFR